MKNIGTIERALRIILGGALAVGALLMMLSASGVVLPLTYFALIALGADFVVTGIRGYCPLYNKLGWNTAKITTQI
jgi:hypothetical protein